jgi:hypothetical protein
MIEVFLGVVIGLMALGLVVCAAWLMDGWVNTSNVLFLGLALIAALIFIGFGFFALLALGLIIGAFAAALGGSQ